MISAQTQPSTNSLYRHCRVEELQSAMVVTKWSEALSDEISAILMDGQIFVISSVCPHFGGEFDFDLEKKELRCKWHDWRFDLRNGRCKSYNVKTAVRHYEFYLDSGEIVVRAP